MKIIAKEPYKDGDFLITIESRSFFGGKNVTEQFVGDLTVWFHFPSGKRAGTMTESSIVNAMQAYRFQNND